MFTIEKDNEIISSITFVTTYVILHIIYKVTGFYYSFLDSIS